MAQGVICGSPTVLEQLAVDLDNNLGRYRSTVAGSASGESPFVNLWQSYAQALIEGYVDGVNGFLGHLPIVPTVAEMTIAGALIDKMIGDAIAYEYMVQSVNSVQVLINYRLNVTAANLQDNINGETANRKAQIGAVATNLQNNINGEVANRKAQIGQAAANLQNNINGETANRQAQIGAVAANLQNNINGETANRQAQVDQVASNLQSNINALSSALRAVIGANVTALQANINTVAEQAIQEVHNAVIDAEAFATGLTAAAVPTAVAKAVAQLQPQVDALKTETAECLDPLCDTVTPNARQLGNLGKLLTGATDALLLGGMLAFLAECAHNPQGAADDISGALGGITNDAANGVRDLIGV